jgi:hypothetical protein
MLRAKRGSGRLVSYLGMPLAVALVAGLLLHGRTAKGSAGGDRELSAGEMAAIFGDALTDNYCQKDLPCRAGWITSPPAPAQPTCYKCGNSPSVTRKVCCATPVRTPPKRCDPDPTKHADRDGYDV